MKKRMLSLLLAVTTATLVGCGSTATDEESLKSAVMDVVESTESASKTEPYGDTITYEPLDYVTLGDYKGIEITIDGDYDVTDEDVQKEAELELSYTVGTTYEETDKTVVEEGDTVNIDYVGKKDGVAFDGGTAQGYNLTIGSGQFIPGFEDGLIGTKVGETVDLDLTFPEEYHSAELAGADVVFTVTVNSIVEPVTVAFEDLTDDFVKENLKMDSVDAYLAEVRKTLEEDAESAKESDITQAILKKLPEICTVTGHPDGLEDERAEQSFHYYEAMADGYGVALSEMLESYGMTEESLRAQLQETVGNTVDIEIILLAIAETEGITDDEAAFEDYVADALEQGGYQDKDELFSEYNENYVRRQFAMDKARELVEENAVVTVVSADEESTEAVTESTEE